MILIKAATSLKILLQASNAAPYPPEQGDPLNVDVHFQYVGDAQVPQYIGTFPIGQEVQIPLAPDIDRDLVIYSNARGPLSQMHENDLRNAQRIVAQSEREQRKPVIGQMGASTYLKAIIGVSYFPRHMKTRRIQVATDAAFTTIIATWYQDVDRTSAETPRLSEQFSVQRLTPTTGAITYYVRVAHASFSTSIATEATYQGKLEGLRWGPNSDVLTITLADNTGAGGSSGSFNPFTATFQGYGTGAGDLAFSVPMPGDSSGGPTGTNNGFTDRMTIWTGSDVLGYSIPIFANRTKGYVGANGFTHTMEAVNAKVDFGAVGNGTTPDTAALANAIAEAGTSGRPLYLPAGTYLADIVLPNDITIIGAGKEKTIIKGTGGGNPVIDGTNSASRLRLRNLTIYGNSGGAGEDGIKIGGVSVANIEITSVSIRNVGGRGIWINSPSNAVFSFEINNVEVEHWNLAATAGVPAFDIDSDGPCIVLRDCYAQATTSANPIGYRIRRNATRTTLLENCNGIDPSAAGSKWCIVGQDTAFGDASNSVAFCTFLNCNIEAFESSGIEFRGTGSFADFLGGNNFTAGATGCRPIWYRSATNPYTSMGQMSGLTTFANGADTISPYAHGQAIESNGCPPLILLGPPGTFGTYSGAINYYDSSVGSVQPIRRLDAFNKVSPTSNYSVASEGVAIINSVSSGAPRTITLLWSGRVRPGQVVIVADATGDAQTNPITVNAAVGTVDGVSSQTIYNNYGALAFYADGDNWKSFGQSKVAGLDWDNGNLALKSFGRFWTGTTGSAGFPAIARFGDEDTGLYWAAANALGFAVGGNGRMILDTVLSLYPWGASAGNTGAIRLFNLAVSGSVTLRAHDSSSAWNLTLPSAPGNGFLAIDASGNVTIGTPAGITGTLNSGRVTLSTGTNTVGDSASLTFNDTFKILTITSAGLNGHLLITDTTNTIDVRIGTLAGAPDRGIAGTMTSDPFVLYQGGNPGWGLDTSRNLVPFGSFNLGTSGSPIVDANISGLIVLSENTSPTSPPSGKIYVYAKATGGFYYKNAAGVETQIGAGGVSGSGTTGKIAKFTGTGTVGDSVMSESSTTITIAGYLALNAANTEVKLTDTGVEARFKVFTSGDSIVGTISNTDFTLWANNGARWRLKPSGDLLPEAAYNIGSTSKPVQDITISRRIVGAGSVPTISLGTGAGTSPSSATDGTPIAMWVQITTGSSPATNAKLFDVTLPTAAPNFYIADIQPANAAAQALSTGQAPFVNDGDATTTKVTVKSGGTALAAGTIYEFYLKFIAV